MPSHKIRRGGAEAVVGGPNWNTVRVDTTSEALVFGTGASGTTEKTTLDTSSTAQSKAGGLTSTSATAGVGYATGAGGAVTQITSIATGVTLSTVTGTITTFAAGAAAGAEDGPFTVTNTTVAATDVVVVAIKSYAGTGTPLVYVSAVGAGSFAITITNLHGATALNAAIAISFAVIKGVAA